MKINTISTYVLVYLLTNGHWNLMVPVKADGGSKSGSDAGSTAGSDAGSTAGSDVAEVSTLGTDGSSASTDATSTGGASGSSSESAPANEGSTSGDANANAYLSSGTVATPTSDADGGSSASPDGASTDADASLGSSGESADGAASADADGSVAVPAKPAEESPLLNGLYPDLFSSGLYGHMDYSETNPELVAKKEEAKLLVEDARKAADKLKEAAEKMILEADKLSQVIEKSGNLEELSAKVDATAYNVAVERTEAANVSKPLDLTYYDSFPSGHHHRADHQVLDKMYSQHRRANNEMYRVDFPTGWHFEDPVLFSEAKKFRENKYLEDKVAKGKEIEDKEKQIKDYEGRIAENETKLAHKKEALEEKTEELSAKRLEVSDMKTLITELQKELAELESQARALVRDQSTINIEYKTLERTHKNLADEHSKLEGEHKALKKEDDKLDSDYRVLNANLEYLHGHKWDAKEPYNDSSVYDTHFPSAAFTTPGIVLEGESGSAPETHTASPVSTATPASEASSAEGQAKVEEDKEAAKVADGSVAAPAVPGAGSTEAKPVEESAEAKAPEAGAKVEEAAPEAKAEAQAAPAHTAGHAAVPEAKAEAQAAPTGVKFYKTGSDGTMVEMVENTDFEKKITVGDDRFDFKTNAKCEKITFDGQDVWKKGDQDVNEPRSVTYRGSLKVLVVRDNDWTVNYKKDLREAVWKLESKTQRAARTGSGSTAATTMTRTGLASPALPRGMAGGSTTNLASSSARFGGSVSNLDTASTTGSDEGKSTGTEDVANLKEVEEDTSGSGSAGTAGATTLRGTGMAGSTAGKTALATPAKKLGQQ